MDAGRWMLLPVERVRPAVLPAFSANAKLTAAFSLIFS